MNKYVLVANQDNELKARFYTGNALLIRNNGENYKLYLEDNGGGYFTLKNTNPNATSSIHIIRCPHCSSKLVKVSQNMYQCIICKGR